MIRTVRNSLAAVALLAMSAPAAAQWIHQESEDDPFAGGATHMAITLSSSGEGISFRCTSIDDLALLFISIEKPEKEHIALMSLMSARLLVIVDNDDKIAFDAEVDTTPNGDRYRFTATSADLAPLAKRVASAKKRMAVAVEVNDKRIYSAAVNVRRSGAAIGKLVKGCGVD